MSNAELERTARELESALGRHHEWLAVFESGRTFPIRPYEVGVETAGGKLIVSIPDDSGYRPRRVVATEVAGDEIILGVTGRFGDGHEEIRFVPRIGHDELGAAIAAIRLQRANELAQLITESFDGLKIEKIDLAPDGGRLAMMIARRKRDQPFGIIADVSDSVQAETQLSAAIAWHERLSARKREPITEIWIIAAHRRSRELRRLTALLKPAAATWLTIVERTRDERLAVLKRWTAGELWREKCSKIALPERYLPSETAGSIIGLAPEEIDAVVSRHGETLRFNGLPFARVRRVAGKEMAWFGTGPKRTLLTPENIGSLAALIDDLKDHRRPIGPHSHHRLYRRNSEAWLETMLNRDIKRLDGNLILSPLYNQFRASPETIDMLAMRNDGRLVIIEIKTSPDRELIFQAAEYWRKIELQRRRGELVRARAFGDRPILNKPALVYTVAPALSFHRDHEKFLRMLIPDIEIWQFELHENWRSEIKVINRRNYRSI